MKYRTHIIAGCALAAFVLSGHYAARSHFEARQIKAQVDALTVRTRIMRHQAGEREQKLRVLQRVKQFVENAEEQHLSPNDWSTYEVNVQDAVTFRELAQIVEQCVHNKNLYYRPIAFHVAMGQDNNSQPVQSEQIEPVVLDADSSDGKPSDVAVDLKGTFLVRH